MVVRENIIFTTYSKAQSELAKGKGRNPTSRKVANNTYLIQREGYSRDVKGVGHAESYIAVRLHNTDVVDIYLDKLVLRTNGWETVTTKDRINSYLPAKWHVYSKRHIWYLSYVTSYGEDGERSRWFFQDGITIRQDGGVYLHEEELNAN